MNLDKHGYAGTNLRLSVFICGSLFEAVMMPAVELSHSLALSAANYS